MLTRMQQAVVMLTIAWSSRTTIGADWPQWRGPSRNGTTPETAWTHEWPDRGPELAWNAPLGGSAPPVVTDGAIVVVSHTVLEKLKQKRTSAPDVAIGSRARSQSSRLTMARRSGRRNSRSLAVGKGISVPAPRRRP